MRSSRISVKFDSPGLWPGILTAATTLAFSGILAGCVLVDNRHSNDTDSSTTTPEPTTPTQTSIDPGKALETKPGEGVGVFVEYQTGGHWHVWTACDTNISGVACQFDVYATAVSGAELSNLKAEGLEDTDAVSIKAGSLHLSAQTTKEFDGMTFDATPGAIVEIEARVDDATDPHVLYWYGDGVLHKGAPTNPIDFKPTAP
jgi:hypothetical protein